MQYTPLTPSHILELIPQQAPFRFIDEILSVDENGIVGQYRFKEDEFFYVGHFPGNPITPGVILLESMCQVGVVAFGIYLLSQEVDPSEISQWVTLFAHAEVEFMKPVRPGTSVIMTSKKVFWRRMKLNAKIEMRDQDGVLLASCIASGIGVRQ